MTTVALLVSMLACGLPVVHSLENEDTKLVDSLKTMVISVDKADNRQATNNKTLDNFILNNSHTNNSLDNLNFKAHHQQPQQPQQLENIQWPNNQGVPAPLQPNQEHQGKQNFWENPPPPPPPSLPPYYEQLKQQHSAQELREQQLQQHHNQLIQQQMIHEQHLQQEDKRPSQAWNAAWDHKWDQTKTQSRRMPDPRVDRQVRKDVEWNYNANYYSLKASSDSKFLIRYAPAIEPGSPWPMPQFYNPSPLLQWIDPNDLKFHMHMGSTKYTYNNNNNNKGQQQKEGTDFYDEKDEVSCSVIDFNIDRFKKIAFGGYWDKEKSTLVKDRWSDGQDSKEGFAMNQLKEITIKVTEGSCQKYPHLNMNESYTIQVSSQGVILSSPEIWGVVRGLETLGQLVFQTEAYPFTYFINNTHIRDHPRFKHRGVLLDTSRHYLDVSTLLENLESMAQNKFNVFHWHIVDDQSFPFVSKSYPNLTIQGAYDYDTHVYTHEDIELILDQARLRGIRVIPEFDTPGHTFSWGFGQNHLLTPCHDFSGEFNGLYGPINPILRKNYNFLKNLYKEIMGLFKDKYLHLGGDEVPFECWMSNPQIKKFMSKNSIMEIKQILSFYARQLFSLISGNAKELKRNTGSIVWQEMFDNDVELPKDTLIQVWSGDSYDLERISSHGYAVLFSTCWYLDYIQYGQDWDKYYICDQIANLRMRNESLFYGGEVCLWAEYTDDSDIMTRLWPRASAAAERLWSNKNINNYFRAAPRLETQRCRMMERGLQVGVMSGPSHCTNFRKKRMQKLKKTSDKEEEVSNPTLNPPKRNMNNYLKDENSERRKTGRYGIDARPNHLVGKEDRQMNRHFKDSVTSQHLLASSDLLSTSGSIGLYLMICLAFFIFFFFLKKKWVKLPVPTYFLTRNYRAFIICLILLTSTFIWFQHIQFYPTKTSSSLTRLKSDQSG